ncbi:MAG TPA: Na+/H+ antiporter NhaA, partial [Prolixibacteraceae bacterium]|nr:Na+/H+ antiporter NhaA [Prolixibacteraceae bacterium]
MNFIKHSLLGRFIRLETSSSIILFLATIAALILANSPLSESFLSFWENKITVSLPGFELSKPVLKWINDGLMAVFFFLIGLEIKREILAGELSNLKKASLPVIAAIGGMVVPALFFVLLNRGNPGMEGWGIPVATDIAFTLGILQLLGKRVPVGLKVFLMAYAIIDDLGAVLIIAFFYSAQLSWVNIGVGLLIVAALLIFAARGYYSKYIFFIAGIIVWVLFLKSGIHATIAGVLMALTIPIQRKTNTSLFYNKSNKLLDEFRKDINQEEKNKILSKNQIEVLDELDGLTENITPPLQHLEHRLHGWVSYLIMPLFAFANAGVVFNFTSDMNLDLSANISISMVLGKTIGIFLFSYLAIKTSFSESPINVTLTHILGVAALGGLGFTMSLFINNLAYTDPN